MFVGIFPLQRGFTQLSCPGKAAWKIWIRVVQQAAK
jgi:hypothetical protein